jgi:glycosyltransferase involved in cell wall biosynthesis
VKSLLYICSLPKASQSGGANAVNYHTFRVLQSHFDCHYVQINPPEGKLGKWVSQLKRKILKKPGKFNFFSEKRLKQISRQFDAIQGNYDFVFFRGFTPWILCRPQVPYVSYNDVHFLQFFRNTFSEKDFIQSDIQRICNQEKEWLKGAKAIAFESAWGAEQCSNDYQLKNVPLIPVGRGGNIPIPDRDRYDGSLNLLVIANNFYQKGGDLVFEAFKSLKPNYSKLELHVVGGDPGQEVKEYVGVVYHGYLYKEREEDLNRLTGILAKAFLLMHITREDTNPLVITEAGYFGCPTITVDFFALPELVKQGNTGVLLPYLPSPENIAETICNLIEEPVRYQQMRNANWTFNREKFSWEQIGLKLESLIESSNL